MLSVIKSVLASPPKPIARLMIDLYAAMLLMSSWETFASFQGVILCSAGAVRRIKWHLIQSQIPTYR
jgi:hypothetical protein